jgi:predicted PurR-regulated permease PerM
MAVSENGRGGALDVDPAGRPAPQIEANRTVLPTVAAVAGVTAALYLGSDIFLPLAIALLLTFALAPLVSRLRRLGLPRPVAVVTVVFAAFMVLAAVGFMVAGQVSELARNLPQYQFNMVEKIRSIRNAGSEDGMLSRVEQVIQRLGDELQRETIQPPYGEVEPSPDPIPVEVIARQDPLEVLQTVVMPLISPIGTAGLVIVVVIFMLMEREDLRDRFIRLVGSRDLHRTTQALQDAGRRVGRYLLMQLVVNVSYAVPIGIGLWLLGIPNALLWGFLALVLRFVPYIGPIIATIFPLFLSLAVDPGWSLLLWTGSLFLVMELIINNAVEPWLYGSRTGLSPLAIIVAAIFWTWIWGPLGLVLSTPLTVCLVVLGRHVPQFEFLDVLFGNEPVLERHARLYQRLLAGDPDEATDHAETFLEERDLVDFHGEVALPALLLGERDRQRGVLTENQRRRISASALTMIENLDAIAAEEADEEVEDETAAAEGEPREENASTLPDGEGISVVSIGGRTELDDAAAAMLGQALVAQGAEVRSLGHADLDPAKVRSLDLAGVDCVVLNYLAADAVSQARFLVRRLKRAYPSLRVGVAFFADTPPERRVEEGRDEAALTRLAETMGADFIVGDLRAAVGAALSNEPAVQLATTPRRIVRKRVVRKPAAAAVKA